MIQRDDTDGPRKTEEPGSALGLVILHSAGQGPVALNTGWRL